MATNVDDGDVVYVDNFKVGYTTGSSAQNITVNYTENSAVGLSGQVTDVDDTTMAAAAIAVTNAKAGDSLSVDQSRCPGSAWYLGWTRKQTPHTSIS